MSSVLLGWLRTVALLVVCFVFLGLVGTWLGVRPYWHPFAGVPSYDPSPVAPASAD